MNAAIWKFLIKHGLGELDLKIKSPKGRYESNDVALNIRKRLNTQTFQHPNKQILIDGYNVLLDPQNWSAFNGGTHESQDREDFDRGRFKTVLEQLKAMDQCLHSNGR